MSHDYDALLSLATALENASSSAKAEAQIRFDAASRDFIYELLRDGGEPDEIMAFLEADLESLSNRPGAESHAISMVRASLLTQFADRARRNARRKRILAAIPVVLIGSIAMTYLGWRFFSLIAIDQPISTREGLKQRAAAVAKVIHYDSYRFHEIPHRRARQFLQFLAWPIEPSATEVEGALEFANEVRTASQGLVEQRSYGPVSCGVHFDGNELGFKLALGNIAQRLSSPDLHWRDPPRATLQQVIRSYACPNREAIQDAVTQGRPQNGAGKIE